MPDNTPRGMAGMLRRQAAQKRAEAENAAPNGGVYFSIEVDHGSLEKWQELHELKRQWDAKIRSWMEGVLAEAPQVVVDKAASGDFGNVSFWRMDDEAEANGDVQLMRDEMFRKGEDIRRKMMDDILAGMPQIPLNQIHRKP